MIPYEDLGAVNVRFISSLRAKFNDVIEKGWFILGNEVKQFEESFAKLHDAKHCIGVASGLDALILSLRALDLEKGSEVIVPSNTYIATIFAVLHCGLKPVLVEPDIETYNIDPEKIEAAITRKTKAVLVVHLYGKCCRMGRIKKICKENKLKLIEDCAQSHGAKFKDQMSGTFGDCGAFSFYPTKNLGALGDGGAVICSNAGIANKIRSLRNYGSSKKYYNEHIGFNSRLDEMQAAFLNIKLNVLTEYTSHKRNLASIYMKELKKDFILPVVRKNEFDVFHIFAIRHQKRDELKKYLLEKNIQTEIHYPLAPHKQVAMKNILKRKSYPVSEEIHRTILSLPCSFAHSENDVRNVIKAMNEF